MRQQHDKINTFRSQLEDLQAQSALAPLALASDSTANGSSPSVDSTIPDLNLSAGEMGKDNLDSPDLPKAPDVLFSYLHTWNFFSSLYCKVL